MTTETLQRSNQLTISFHNYPTQKTIAQNNCATHISLVFSVFEAHVSKTPINSVIKRVWQVLGVVKQTYSHCKYFNTLLQHVEGVLYRDTIEST